ncbi:MAG: 3-methyl-2-oxobutanoate dehydrogenase subunit beta, partial [Bacteroidales bacterium]
VAYGTSARVCQKALQMARADGIKAGLLRPITLYPYPSKRISDLAPSMKHIVSVEMSAGQMVEDVRLAVNGKTEVSHFGRLGGVLPTPEEVYEYLKHHLIKEA